MFALNDMPLWLFAVDVLVLTSIFFLGGVLQGKRAAAKDESEGPVGSMVAAVLALLAFMLAFTFGLATGRYDERRLLVLDEANAIGTTYLRCDFLEEPAKIKMRKLLRQYVEARIHMYDNPGGVDAAIKKSTELQTSMWAIAAELGNKKPTPISSLFVSTLNEMIDLQEKRITAGMYTRVPSTVWLYLMIVSALSMSGMGYYSGKKGSRAWAEAVILITCYGAVLLLAADLDRPHSGTLVTNQQPLIDVAKQIGAE